MSSAVASKMELGKRLKLVCRDLHPMIVDDFAFLNHFMRGVGCCWNEDADSKPGHHFESKALGCRAN